MYSIVSPILVFSEVLKIYSVNYSILYTLNLMMMWRDRNYNMEIKLASSFRVVRDFSMLLMY